MKKGTKKKDPRGRKSKRHEPIDASFKEVLGAIAKSKYKDEKVLKAKNKSHGRGA
ncbi:MAG: hypothetical protein AB203_03275 [Parcubacteria bacterium C7867-008]|nr:MAG: hypothetical protein AB203_03275 [Parcubacteria bacterium C7867-008]